MKVILFGATGMVGRGALQACLDDPGVTRVLAVARTAPEVTHAKLEVLLHKDFTDYTGVEAQLQGWDACLFCLGVSAAGMSEADYRRVTYDYALAAGRTLARLNPAMRFLFVSGQSTDSTGTSRMMWARVKGETENALLALPFQAFMLRPGYIQPVGGFVSKTLLYRVVYAVLGPLYPLLKPMFPGAMIDNLALGRAMVRVAREGSDRKVLESIDLTQLAG
ncbi:MAG: hypothetical protein U0325_04915 [Polyangiales bacterium]